MKVYRVLDTYGTTEAIYYNEEDAKKFIYELINKNKHNDYSIEEIEIIE